ncbi:epoxide hydrolase [Flagelloscypha sp. PMI_526]|nr:epoxide hydrolase [Flagelloscypha sp. PMI_526]
MSFTTTPFTISISQARLKDLEDALKAARLPPPFFEGTQPPFGMTTDWLRGALDAWKTTYDWKTFEDRVNTLSQFVADVPYDGSAFKIHYIHQQSTAAGGTEATPLLLLHGWPGSFFEFLNVIEPLAAANFDVVVASLPGFTFSQKPPLDKDFGRNEVAKIMNSLMQGLGYNEYAVHGGDLGSYVARILATDYSQNCKALHLTMFLAAKPDGIEDNSVPQDEQQGLQQGAAWLQTGFAYGMMHGTRPSTIAHVVSSSPLALLAWIAEKVENWTDETPSLTTILDLVTLWYFTDTFPTSVYFYREDVLWFGAPSIAVPFGYTWNKFDVAPTPEAYLRGRGNFKWFRKHQKGGHFFALERPETFVKDIQDCFSELWK